MWVGVLIGVVAGLVAIAVPLALILGVPLADAMRGGAGVSGALILAAATLFILPAALHRDGPLPRVRVPARPGWGRIGSRRRSRSGATFPTCRTCSGRQRRMARLSAWWRSSSRSSWPSWSCERSSNGRVDRRSTATSSRSAKARVRSGSVSTGRGCRSRGATRSRGTRARRTWRASSSWRDGPESMRRASETPAEHARRIRADPIGPPMGRLAADYALIEFGEADVAAVRASSSDRAVAAPSFDRCSASRQDRPRKAAGLTARARQLFGALTTSAR